LRILEISKSIRNRPVPVSGSPPGIFPSLKTGEYMPYLKMTAVTLAMACCVSDLLYGKIFNLFWLTGVFCGVLENLLLSGKSGGASLMGCVFPLAAGAWLFYFRMIGGGDIKELSALGAVAGIRMTMKICCCSLVFGACIAGMLCLMNGNISGRLGYFFRWIMRRFVSHEKVPYMLRNKDRDYIQGQKILPLECFHFSVPVFMAVLFYAGGYLG
jgi:Flp pilus assembly protein protease CpaA